MTYRPLSKELQELAIIKLNENPDTLEDDLKLIREWAKTETHLGIKTDDQWLLSFIRGCKFNLELVKQKLTVLYTMRSRTPEWFANRDPFLPEIQELLNLGLWLPLRKPADPVAPLVVLCRESTDTLNFKLSDRAKLAFMMLDICTYEDDNYIVAGGSMIGDGKNVTIKHVVQVRPHLIEKCYKICTQGYAIRPRAFHALNAPSFAVTAFNTFKHLASKKLWSRVNFYKSNDSDELYKHVPISVLPEEYGGKGGSLKDLTTEWKKKVESYRDWFLEEQYCFDETEFFEEPDVSEELFDMNMIA